MQPKQIVILGSTGSIGTQALEVVRAFPDKLDVFAISGNSNVDLLTRQALEFEPPYVVATTKSAYQTLSAALESTGSTVLFGQEGLCDVAVMAEVDVVLAALVGFAGLRSTLAALEEGKVVAVANKEALVAAGHLVEDILLRRGGRVVPVDSEHSAIHQCLVGEPQNSVESIILTASGGPFRDRPIEKFSSIRIEDALAHPNWSMGSKISIDSATMMNKGLEVIEAHWLFHLPPEKIDVVVHRQSIIHSMVNFVDGSTKAQLGVPDMKVPIQYALSYPNRWASANARLDWSTIPTLDFEPIDNQRFPCLGLAYEALRQGGSLPAVLNAANEYAVSAFLQGAIHYTAIPSVIEQAMLRHDIVRSPSLDDLIEIDTWARSISEQKRQGTH
ncbi:MAG: 1-deoxy-D-xylulose-5-phosphate reductoisomerase [Rhodothermales bacterium]|nr:1-deoxy-D-xylulose-5-phosphate reductoisomerase [Rhodothermales bacterium]